ncbi:MAG: TonB-dependent receptor [Bacteroidales bacterium]|nr:TonB-dependent receptor [Bacteroidales bacterium]
MKKVCLFIALYLVSIIVYADKNVEDSELDSLINSCQEDGLCVCYFYHDYIKVNTGHRDPIDINSLPTTVTIVNSSVIETNHQTSVLPFLNEFVPGCFSTSRGVMGYGVDDGSAGDISIRGLNSGSGRVMVLIDGNPQYDGFMKYPWVDSYQTYWVDHVEVLRGPASMMYGSNAMGGVVNIISKEPENERCKTFVNVGYGLSNTLRSDVTNMIKRKRFSSFIGGSYNRTDGHRKKMDFEQYGMFAKLNFDITKNWRVNSHVNFTHYNASQPGTMNVPLNEADHEVTEGMTSFNLRNEYEKTSGSIRFFCNFGRFWMNEGYTVDPSDDDKRKKYRIDIRNRLMGVSLNQQFRLFDKKDLLTVGVDMLQMGGVYQHEYVESRDASDIEEGHHYMSLALFLSGCRKGDVYVEDDRFEYEVAGYVDYKKSIANWMTIDAGIRCDHHSLMKAQWVPQGGVSFHPHDRMNIKAVVGRGIKFPSIKEKYWGNAANPELSTESVWSYELLVEQRNIKDRLSYTLNLFYLKGKDLIVCVPNDEDYKKTYENINTGQVQNIGVELKTLFNINKHWTLDANYGYIYMKYPVVATPEQKLNIGAKFSTSRGMFHTGLNYIHNLLTSMNQDTKEQYLLWHIRGDWKATRWLTIWAKGENLLNQAYEVNAGYPMPGVTAMLGLTFNF